MNSNGQSEGSMENITMTTRIYSTSILIYQRIRIISQLVHRRFPPTHTFLIVSRYIEAILIWHQMLKAKTGL